MLNKKTCGGIIKTLAFFIAVTVLFTRCVTVIKAENDIESELRREERQAEAIERMRLGFEEYSESIDLSDLSVSPDELGMLFAHATKDTPYLFYVSNNLSYTYRTGGDVISVIPKYNVSKEEADDRVSFCKSEIEKMAKLIGSIGDDMERMIAAHDLICKSYSYDTTLKSNNIYTFLKTRTGTCQGYTWTYMALLRALGIECRYVASDSIAHIWLAVKIDGEWYHSDVTWDDPPSAEGSGEISREHLLFSDAKADEDGYTDRYSSVDIECESNLYDGDDLASSFPPCGFLGDVDHDGEVDLYDLLLLRYYLEYGDATKQKICCFCADSDRNFCVDEEDAVYIRRALLYDVNP